MALKYCILLVCCCLTLSISAQRSNQWMLGWIGKMDFNSGTAQYYPYNDTLRIRQSNAGIADTSGQILFWTNGSAIFQSDRDTMQNGELLHLPFMQGYIANGIPIHQGSLAFPYPGNPNWYYLFHASVDYFATSPTELQYRSNFYSSIIDMTANGGLGSVISNSQFLEDSIQRGNMTAVKHANGRDWWLIGHEIASSLFYVWLINPSGISPVQKQNIGTTTANGKQIGQLTFSQDGQYLAYTSGKGSSTFKLEVISFDRCSGQFGNVVKTGHIITPFDPYNMGTSFSPSGRFVYVTSTSTLHQFDMDAPSLNASQLLIDTYNGTQAPFGAFFSHMYLASDGKIYCHSTNGNWTLHVINSPDSLGPSCNFVQNQFSTGIWYSAFSSLPNMPNYELGPLVGSPCDTLTSVEEFNVNDNVISIHPNPTAGSITIQLPQNTAGKARFELVDLLGRKAFEQELNNPSETHMISLPTGITNGVYVCRLIADRKVYSEKMVLER